MDDSSVIEELKFKKSPKKKLAPSDDRNGILGPGQYTVMDSLTKKKAPAHNFHLSQSRRDNIPKP